MKTASLLAAVVLAICTATGALAAGSNDGASSGTANDPSAHQDTGSTNGADQNSANAPTPPPPPPPPPESDDSGYHADSASDSGAPAPQNAPPQSSGREPTN
ncbi:MAG: hypothetical protein ISS15_01080 [Alphaproteobacteria bacterium]|nr:hypothetical protein [Alphaproteobacteria bacterium]MBL7096224.1 hypothetical protein [Alphaproteobacteria bacterium]